MDALLKSVNFNVASAGAPLAGKAEIEALQRERQALLAKLADNEARLRKLGAVASGGPAGAELAGAAAATPDEREKLLAQARERFTKELDLRRKPHTVLGDILMLD